MNLRHALSALPLLAVFIAAPLRAEVVDIDNAKLQELIAQGVPVVDLRTAPEWSETGVVKGSHLMTFFDEQGRANPESWVRKLQSVAAPDQPVILICRSGNRTSKVAAFLDQQVRYRKVYNVRDGIRKWSQAGLPLEKPSVQQATVHCGGKAC